MVGLAAISSRLQAEWAGAMRPHRGGPAQSAEDFSAAKNCSQGVSCARHDGVAADAGSAAMAMAAQAHTINMVTP